MINSEALFPSPSKVNRASKHNGRFVGGLDITKLLPTPTVIKYRAQITEKPDLVKFAMCTLVSRVDMTLYILTEGYMVPGNQGTHDNSCISTLLDEMNELQRLEMVHIPWKPGYT